MSLISILLSDPKLMAILGKLISLVMMSVMTFSIARIMSTSLSSSRRIQNIENSNVAAIGKKSDISPKIVLLLTFPNSGTTYITELVTSVTGTVTATNYGDEYSDEKENILIKPSWDNGPFLVSDQQTLPNKFLLTKTHCGGWFFNSPPEFYIGETLELFEEHCVTGTRMVFTEQHGELELIKDVVQYELDIVYKMVHLIRNPFDNLVSRFHHEYTNALFKKQRTRPFSFNYPYNAQGFQSWCRDIDTRYWQEEQKYYPAKIKPLAQLVPCHAELYRYITWHNNAFSLTSKYKSLKPRHILYYEDFQTNFEFSIQELIDFLELNRINKPLPFTFGENIHYFSMDQRYNIAAFSKMLASNETWVYLKHYFSNIMNDYHSDEI